MDIFLYNTLARKKEPFSPLTGGRVSMYHCGPTVYDYAHIGNLRSFVFADILRRFFEYKGFAVTQVINITDVGHLTSDRDYGEDKMTSALKREGKPITLSAMKEVADFYAEKFTEDLSALNIKQPQYMPKASEHIPEDIALVGTLLEKGVAYRTNDGIYFDTDKSAGYGTLAGLDIEGMKEGARVAVNPEKKNPADFALWKFNNNLGWDAPFGKGFPGWHIECSAMSMKYLGESFDIHTGGIDLIPTHHTNEIAQSEAATGKPFVRYWMHSGFVNMGGEKMAKRTGAFIRLQDLTIQPLAYRYWLLTAHYRKTVNFTDDAANGSSTALRKLYAAITVLPDNGSIDEAYRARFEAALADDINTAEALAILHELLHDDSVSDGDKKATALDMDRVLGLALARAETYAKESPVPDEVLKLAEARETARNNGDFARADKLRADIAALGYTVRDTETGTEIVQS
ncbi:MAG: cysteine--tRNA ligase [Candidatus Lloydbacteria bacterium CG22_combo_CG10-13_8_21_14_all_47_15]|uniref:Cysteine--tRNA ligase n=1 Tax=Candidatus Lloydbacteria bacterium CG22_combo_CG10-13_8_21_14_all_47_15 TaxID=1974635 RepID=A0A2H0CTC7_9BACT|nr:MAG: cysteine--tRNA ligase [Candidatus Lloydbacteria bacterium CG22_combo_CG10-13_8_21_14_all_47_15]